MKVTEDKREFMEAWLDTPFYTVALRKRGTNIATADVSRDFGVLVAPAVDTRETKFDHREALSALIRQLSPAAVIKVRGHGWSGETPMVWSGSPDEFIETWTLD